jgi:[ribosomal protein S5]-alanine N-acetyltransferase
MIIETPRLRLHRFTLADAPFIFELLTSAGWLKYIGDRGVYSIAGAENYLNSTILKSYEEFNFGFWLVKDKLSGQKMGLCGISQRPELEGVDLGFAFLSPFIRHGFGYEASIGVLNYAFQQYDFDKIRAIVNPNNAVSIKLLEKLGFVFDKKILFSTKNTELLLYDISKTDFLPSQGSASER